jgi:hypothetical protein
VKIIPPGGFAGYAQMAPSSQNSLTKGLRTYTPRHKRKGTKAAKRYKRNKRILSRAKSKGPARRRGPAKMAKGSAAAKAWGRKMAALRRK